MGEPHHFQKTAKAVGSFQQLLKVLYLEVTQHQHTEIPLDTGLRKTFMKMDQLHLLYLTHIICLTEITADRRNKVLVYQSTLRKSYKKLLWQPEIWSETHKNGRELHILLSWESQEEKDLKQRILCHFTQLHKPYLSITLRYSTAPLEVSSFILHFPFANDFSANTQSFFLISALLHSKCTNIHFSRLSNAQVTNPLPANTANLTHTAMPAN